MHHIRIRWTTQTSHRMQNFWYPYLCVELPAFVHEFDFGVPLHHHHALHFFQCNGSLLFEFLQFSEQIKSESQENLML